MTLNEAYTYTDTLFAQAGWTLDTQDPVTWHRYSHPGTGLVVVVRASTLSHHLHGAEVFSPNLPGVSVDLADVFRDGTDAQRLSEAAAHPDVVLRRVDEYDRIAKVVRTLDKALSAAQVYREAIGTGDAGARAVAEHCLDVLAPAIGIAVAGLRDAGTAQSKPLRETSPSSQR